MYDGSGAALRCRHCPVARYDTDYGRAEMTPSQGNSWAVIYSPRGLDCVSNDTGWQHQCQFVVLRNNSTSCDFTHPITGATSSAQNALDWHLSDSRLTSAVDARQGTLQASNCKTITVYGGERAPIDYAPRTTQQITATSALLLAVAATACLFVGVRRLLGMLHSAIRARVSI